MEQEDAWDKCIKCPTCYDPFTPGVNSERCPLVSTCGHTLCQHCFQRYKQAGRNDEDGVEKAPHLWTKKRQCHWNCAIRSTKKLPNGQKLQVDKPIADAFQFDNPILNESFLRALEALLPLRAAAPGDTASDTAAADVARRIEDLQNDPNAFDKCGICHVAYSSSNLRSSDNREVLHPQAPLVGRCGHTFCQTCVWAAHAHELELRQSRQLRKFPCPTCHQPAAFHADRLYDNCRFRDAVAYWEALKQHYQLQQDVQQQQHQQKQEAGIDAPSPTRVKDDTEPIKTEDISAAAAGTPAFVNSPASIARIKLEEGSSSHHTIKLEEGTSSVRCWKFLKSPSTDGAGSSTMMAIKVEDLDGPDDDNDDDDDDDDGTEDDEEVARPSHRLPIQRDETVEAAERAKVETGPEQADDDSADESVIEILDSDDDESTASDVQLVEISPDSLGEPAASPPIAAAAAAGYQPVASRSPAAAPATAEDLDTAMGDYWLKSGNREMVSRKLDDDMDDYWSKKKKRKGAAVNSDGKSPSAPGGQQSTSPINMNSNDVIELLSDDNDDDDDEEDILGKGRPIKRYRVGPQRSRQAYRGADALELLKHVEVDHKLHFLCYDEFRQFREWHLTHDDFEWVCIMPDTYVKSLLGPNRYNYMLRRSMSVNFSTLQYTGKPDAEWLVTTNQQHDRILESDFVGKAYRPEFLAVVMADPSKKHKVEPWCRMFPPQVFFPNTSRPHSDFLSAFTIQFPLTENPIDDWKLVFAFASAVSYMKGLPDAAKVLHQSGARQPSDNMQIERLEKLIAEHLPKYTLVHSLTNSSNHNSCLAELAAQAEEAPIIIRPKLARGSHVFCYMVIFRNQIFEPSFGHALWLNKKNLDLCCGGYMESGEFLGVIESWRLVLPARP